MHTESKTISGIGHDGILMIFNVDEQSWDLMDAVDTSHPRYRATEDDMDGAITAAEGTLIRNIDLSE